MTTEPPIICPKCSTEIKLTESLAAPLMLATRREYEARLTQQQQNLAKRENEGLETPLIEDNTGGMESLIFMKSHAA